MEENLHAGAECFVVAVDPGPVRGFASEPGAADTGQDRGELTVARRFFANATDAERDLIAYWQMVKLVEDAYVRYTRGGDA